MMHFLCVKCLQVSQNCACPDVLLQLHCSVFTTKPDPSVQRGSIALNGNQRMVSACSPVGGAVPELGHTVQVASILTLLSVAGREGVNWRSYWRKSVPAATE